MSGLYAVIPDKDGFGREYAVVYVPNGERVLAWTVHKADADQIAAALNATAPGQAAEGQPLVSLCICGLEHGHRSVCAPEPAGEQRRCGCNEKWICREHAMSPPDPQPAEAAPYRPEYGDNYPGTQEEIAAGFARLEQTVQGLVAAAAPGGEREPRTYIFCSAHGGRTVPLGSGCPECPADPGEELRLLEELTEVDWDFVVSYLAADGGGSYKKLKELLPRLSQLDALRTKKENK